MFVCHSHKLTMKPTIINMANCFLNTIIIFCVIVIRFSNCSESSDSDYGVLAAESSTDKENFCIIYYKDFSTLPSTKDEAQFHILQNDSLVDWCEEHPESDVTSKVLLLLDGNCSISVQAQNVHDRGGEGILFITPSGKRNTKEINSTIAKEVNMTVGLISENSVERLKKMHDSISVRIFAPKSMNFDFSLLLIWLVSVFTVAIGSYWSGLIRFAIYCKEVNSLPGGGVRELPNKPSVTVNTTEESSINVSAVSVAAFVCCMGLMLVLLYFFFAYLICFIIILFAIASALAVHSCLEPLVMKIKLECCKAKILCRTKSCNIDFRQVLLVIFSMALSIYWLVIRNEKYSWILNDILGVAFCIHMLKSIRLPSFKICTILLVLLFFYDIFFVFVTPFFTKGESVMEEVATGGATGGSSTEVVPMLLRVPHLTFDAKSVCYEQYSLLGFGDILVPGLLVSYCHGYDLVTNKKKIYFLVTTVAYGIGMIVTFAGLFLMNTAQPALLYLVPCTLIPPAIIAWCRGEFSTLWKGFRQIQPPPNISADPEVVTGENAPTNEEIDNTINTTIVKANATNDSNERNYLLR